MAGSTYVSGFRMLRSVTWLMWQAEREAVVNEW